MQYFLVLVDSLSMGNICNKAIHPSGGIPINIPTKDHSGVYSHPSLFLKCVILSIVCVSVQ